MSTFPLVMFLSTSETHWQNALIDPMHRDKLNRTYLLTKFTKVYFCQWNINLSTWNIVIEENVIPQTLLILFHLFRLNSFKILFLNEYLLNGIQNIH